jgi:hypothetical protein
MSRLRPGVSRGVAPSGEPGSQGGSGFFSYRGKTRLVSLASPIVMPRCVRRHTLSGTGGSPVAKHKDVERALADRATDRKRQSSGSTPTEDVMEEVLRHGDDDERGSSAPRNTGANGEGGPKRPRE